MLVFLFLVSAVPPEEKRCSRPQEVDCLMVHEMGFCSAAFNPALSQLSSFTGCQVQQCKHAVDVSHLSSTHSDVCIITRTAVKVFCVMQVHKMAFDDIFWFERHFDMTVMSGEGFDRRC